MVYFFLTCYCDSIFFCKCFIHQLVGSSSMVIYFILHSFVSFINLSALCTANQTQLYNFFPNLCHTGAGAAFHPIWLLLSPNWPSLLLFFRKPIFKFSLMSLSNMKAVLFGSEKVKNFQFIFCSFRKLNICDEQLQLCLGVLSIWRIKWKSKYKIVHLLLSHPQQIRATHTFSSD